MLPSDIPIGSLVGPRKAKCVINQRTTRKKRGRYVYKKVSIGAIKICSVPNRERPTHMSRYLFLGETAIVLDYFEGRYPMVKLLTAAGGEQWVGWALLDDIEPAPLKETDNGNI